MIFKKHRENLYIKRYIKRPVSEVVEQISRIKKVSENICICPGTTGYAWMGVNRATKALFPNYYLELPQYFSQSAYNVKELDSIVESLNSSNFNNIIFSGFAPYFEKLILGTRKANSRICLIYHGFLSELAENRNQAFLLRKIIELTKTGTIHRLAFNKKGLSETMNKIYNIESYHILLKTPSFLEQINKVQKQGNNIKIGVLANNQFRKNIYNQIAAALMIDNCTVHIAEKNSLTFFSDSERIVSVGNNLPHKQYLEYLVANDLNMYISYSESWGMVITESLVLGVPCLAAYNTGLFDYDDYLHEMLIVKEFDDSNAIYKLALKVLENRDEISRRGIKYVESLNMIAEQKLKNFLE